MHRLITPKPKHKKIQTSKLDIVRPRAALSKAKTLQIKTPGPLPEVKPSVANRLSTSFAFVKTRGKQKYYNFLQKTFSAPRFALKLAVVALMVMLATIVPSMWSSQHRSDYTVSIASAWGDSNIDIWWPTDGAKVSGQQPFKAMLQGKSVDQYRMVWQVDAGQENEMQTSTQDYPHKESLVDLSGWNWKGQGPYTISFTAYDLSGNKLGAKYETIYLGSISTAVVKSAATQTPAVSPITSAVAAVAAPVSSVQTASITLKSLDIWWPASGANLSGNVPFKVMLQNTPVSDYTAFWQVDGGALNEMPTNYQDYPHKESLVDLAGWTWKGRGPYVVTFIAKAGGQTVASKSVSIYNASFSSSAPTPTTSVPVSPAPVPAISQAPAPVLTVSGNPFSGQKLYVNPNTDPARWANDHRSWDAANAKLMDKVAAGAETQWFGNWSSLPGDVSNYVSAATNAGAMPTIVAYNIPNRDCGGYSSGGTGSTDAYKSWIRSFAAGIGGRKAVVILEPDALSLTSCLSPSDLQTRYDLLTDAVNVLKGNGNTSVYIDAGHPNWISAGDMISRLKQAGIDKADGFALNISNFFSTQDNVSYGQSISAQVGGKHFIIDTGRNGSGPAPDYAWCNPSGRSLGALPTTQTGNPLVDAYLWVKGPGGSDGNCNGGPNAGIFFPDYALGLARNTSW